MKKLIPLFAALLLIAGYTAPAQENCYRQVTAEEAAQQVMDAAASIL